MRIHLALFLDAFTSSMYEIKQNPRFWLENSNIIRISRMRPHAENVSNRSVAFASRWSSLWVMICESWNMGNDDDSPVNGRQIFHPWYLCFFFPFRQSRIHHSQTKFALDPVPISGISFGLVGKFPHFRARFRLISGSDRLINMKLFPVHFCRSLHPSARPKFSLF